MTPSLQNFKSQYPEGRLISDLITIQDGQYVVRTVVEQEGEVLATGLAASADVQIAEDRARERAIAALGISLSKDPVEEDPVEEDPVEEDPVEENGSRKQEVLEPRAPMPAAPVDTPTTVSERSSDEFVEGEAVLPLEDVALPAAEEDLGPPIDAIEDSPVTLPPTKPSAATIALESFSASANPVDLSDVIAQTDVELTRLGWTSAQGRDYLEKTYGKRSRQQLTNEELMSFLLYLEDQP